MAEPRARSFVVFDPTRQPAIPFRIPDPYKPPKEIASSDERFWTQVNTAPEELHWRWIGAASRPRIYVDGRTYTIWDFAYLSKVDEIYPGLFARAVCGHELCVRTDHLGLRWRRNQARPSRDVLFFAFSMRERYLEVRRQRHRDLWSEKGIAEAYGLPIAEVEACYYEFRKQFTLRCV